MARDHNPPTTEDNRQRIISSFISMKNSLLKVTRSLLEAHKWDINATVCTMNIAYADERNEPKGRNKDPRLLDALTRCLNPQANTSHLSPSLSLILSQLLASYSNGIESDSGEKEEDPVEAKDSVEDNVKETDVETTSVTTLRTLREINSVTPPLMIPQVVTIWRNGLTIVHDPPSESDDSKDPVFLEVVESLESPHVHVSTNGTIHFLIKFKRYEKDYYPPFQAFQGVGRTLDGSVSASTEPLDLEKSPNPKLPVRSGKTTFRSDMKQRGGNIHTLADISSGTDNDTDEQDLTTVHDPYLDEENNAKKSLSETRSRTLSDILSFTPQAIPRVLTLWSNIVTVHTNPSPLKLDDAADNAIYHEFIEDLDSPLIRLSPDGKIHFLVKFIKRYEENYYAPNEFRPFQGVGRKLGRPVSASTEHIPSMDHEESPAEIGHVFTEPPASMDLVIDLEAPTTWNAIMLAGGTWICSTFNTHHTIRDIRGFIDAVRPGDSKYYKLLIPGSPFKELNDLDQTIEQAGISFSVIIQMF